MENILLETLKSLILNFYMYFFVLLFAMYWIISITVQFSEFVLTEDDLLYN
jgi:hypothetical protein